MKNKKVIVSFGILLLILIVVSIWFYLKNQNNILPVDQNSSEVTEILKINPYDFIVFEVKYKDFPKDGTDRFFNIFNDAQKILLQNQEKGLEANDQDNFYAWLEITGVQKVIWDFDRAEKIWKWFTYAYPGNSVSPANLGEMYKTFVVNNEEAEKYYLIALEREQKNFQIYLGLFDVYRYRFEDQEKAIEVMKQGIENNPNNSKFIIELADYLIENEKKEEAEKIVDEFIEKYPDKYGIKADIFK